MPSQPKRPPSDPAEPAMAALLAVRRETGAWNVGAALDRMRSEDLLRFLRWQLLGEAPKPPRQLPPRGSCEWGRTLLALKGVRGLKRRLRTDPRGQQYWALVGSQGWLALYHRLRAEGGPARVREHMAMLGRASWSKRQAALGLAKGGQGGEDRTGSLDEGRPALTHTREDHGGGGSCMSA